ncbi:fibronectin type III domain-containing protein [Desulfonema ishimotonii]|nr:fibronectin type III domain-containing protein [Desulfonema ishimotonii]
MAIICLISSDVFASDDIGATGSEQTSASDSSSELSDFPDISPNADISVLDSAFGIERVRVVCHEAASGKAVSYRLLQKGYDSENPEGVFDPGFPSDLPDFTFRPGGWDALDVMVIGYDGDGQILTATPKARIDLSRLGRKQASGQPSVLKRSRTRSSGLTVDSSQFPLIRIYGDLPTSVKRSSATEPPVVEESGTVQDVVELTQSDNAVSADILLVADNSISMASQTPWFMPGLREFIGNLSDSDMDCRIGLLPFSSAEQTRENASGSDLFYDSPDQVNAALKTKLTFDSPCDDALSALEIAADSVSRQSSARKILILMSNEAIHADQTRADQILNRLRQDNIQVFAFLPKQSRFSQLITRRTYGGFLNFHDDALSDLLPWLSAVAYQASDLTGTGLREVRLAGSDGKRSSDEDVVAADYTAPTPFDIMLLPRTSALPDTQQQRRKAVKIWVRVAKQDPEIADPGLTLYYTDSRNSEYKTLTMTEGDDEDVFFAEIPAEEMGVYGINYYIEARLDGYQISLPPKNPEEQPYSFAVAPNFLPRYTFSDTPRELVPGQPFTIEAKLYDETQQVRQACLYYRSVGQTEYQHIVKEFDERMPAFEADIPAEVVTSAGIEYYLSVTDDKGAVRYIGNMEDPRQAFPVSQSDDNSRRSTRSGATFNGNNFTIHADSITTDAMNNRIATGNIYIGLELQTDPMIGYRGGSLEISSDGTTFKTLSDTGTLFAVGIKTRKNTTAHNEDLFTGGFQRNPDDRIAAGELSLKLNVKPQTEKIITLYEHGLVDLNSRYTATSKIEVKRDQVSVTGAKADLVLQNRLFKFFDFGGVTSLNTLIWSRNELVTTSKTTVEITGIKLGDFDLLDAGITIDPINWGLEISAGGLAFGALNGPLMSFSVKKFSQLKKGDGSKLKGFVIGAQLNPPAITRLKFDLGVPNEIADLLTVPHVAYSGIPVGIAPKTVGFDLRDLALHTPLSVGVMLEGHVLDCAKIMRTIQTFIFTSFVSGKIAGTLDLSGTIGLSGDVSVLSVPVAGFDAQVSKYEPQLRLGGKLGFGFGPIGMPTEMDMKVSFPNETTAKFSGSSTTKFVPPVHISLALRLVGACSGACEISGLHGSISGSADTSGNMSLSMYGETYLQYSVLECTSGWGWAWFVPYCKGWGWKTHQYKVWTNMTLLPKPGAQFGAGKRSRDIASASEPGIFRETVYVGDDENGDPVEAVVEFNYGRPVGVFTGGLKRDGLPVKHLVTLDQAHENATIIVTSNTSAAQVRVECPIEDPDNPEHKLTYDSNTNTGADNEELISFSSDATEHMTVGVIKSAPAGDYLFEILNPGDTGAYTVEVTVPNRPPEFEITSSQVVAQNETQDIIEVTYNLSDEDSESTDVFATFRLAETGEVDDTDTALFLIPENAGEGTAEEMVRVYGTGQAKTVRLVIDRTNIKPGDYKLYGKAEDMTTAPVVSWSDLEKQLAVSGIPGPPENFRRDPSETASVLLEWEPRPESEKVIAYAIKIESSDKQEQHEIRVDGGETAAYELVGLKNGTTYVITIFSINEKYEWSLPGGPLTVTPGGLTVDGAPDLVVGLDATHVSVGPAGAEWGDWDEWDDPETDWFKVFVTITNKGNAPSTGGFLSIYYGKLAAEFAIVDKSDGEDAEIDPLLPGESVTYEYLIDMEFMKMLTDGQEIKFSKKFPCIFTISDVGPAELDTYNNTGMVEKLESVNVSEHELTLKEGWNFIALPADIFVSACVDPEMPGNTFGQIFGQDITIRQYYEGEWLTYANFNAEDESALGYVYSDEGFWVYVPSERTVTLAGWKYSTDPYWLSESTWSMMGTGTQIDAPLTYFQNGDEQGDGDEIPYVEAVWAWDTDSGQWIKNPASVVSGQGFWVSRSATEQPPEYAVTGDLEKLILILKLLTGKDFSGYPVDELDVVKDSRIDLQDAIRSLQVVATATEQDRKRVRSAAVSDDSSASELQKKHKGKNRENSRRKFKTPKISDNGSDADSEHKVRRVIRKN